MEINPNTITYTDLGGGWQVIDGGEIRYNDSGWDERCITLARVSSSPPSRGGHNIGQEILSNWWVCGINYIYAGGVIWLLKLECKGRHSSAVKIRITTGTEQQSGQNVETPEGRAKHLRTLQPTLEVERTYLQRTTVDTSVVGSAQDPPNAPAAPANVWSGYLEEYEFRWPNGWVLMARNVDYLTGTTAALVTDHYSYIQALAPI